jgi:hypothetical protein
LLSQLRSLAREDKLFILYQFLCDLVGKHPQEEYGIYDPEGREFAYLLPPELRHRLELSENQGLLDELRRRSQTPARSATLSEFFSQLKSSESSRSSPVG